MIEKDKEYYNQKIGELYAVIENQEKIIRDLQKEKQQLKQIIEEAQQYNKTISKLYDVGCMEKSNADTNLIILRDKETLEKLKGGKNEKKNR